MILGIFGLTSLLHVVCFSLCRTETKLIHSWRTQRRSTQNQNRQPGQQQRRNTSNERSSGGQTPVRQLSETQGLSAMSGNAWPGDRPNRDSGSHGPVQEQHIPVRSFNAHETREDLLRSMYRLDSILPRSGRARGTS